MKEPGTEFTEAFARAAGDVVERAADVPTVKEHCQHCGVAFNRPESMEFGSAYFIRLHEAHCATRSADDRAFYVAHRRWPLPPRPQEESEP